MNLTGYKDSQKGAKKIFTEAFKDLEGDLLKCGGLGQILGRAQTMAKFTDSRPAWDYKEIFAPKRSKNVS